MITIILAAAGALTICFGGPALVEPVRAALARRAAARTEAEQAKQDQRLAQQRQLEERARQWREHPDLAGLAELLNYMHQIQMHLQHAITAARLTHQRLAQRVEEHSAEIRDGRPITPMYKVLVLGGLVAFAFATVLSVVLDYLIFRGLHPTGTAIFPAGLACVAVLCMTIGSVLLLGARRHGLLPASVSAYWRRVVAVAGACLILGVTAYMASIAPNRSVPASQHAIDVAAENLANDQSAVPASPTWLIAQDKLQLARAKSTLAHQEQVDRLSALVLAAIEVASSEAAVLGYGLLALEVAIRRSDRSQRELQRAENDLEVVNYRWYATVLPELIRHGHDESVFPLIHARLAGMGSTVVQAALPDGTVAGADAGLGRPGDLSAAAPDAGRAAPWPVVPGTAEPGERSDDGIEPVIITGVAARPGVAVTGPATAASGADDDPSRGSGVPPRRAAGWTTAAWRVAGTDPAWTADGPPEQPAAIDFSAIEFDEAS